MTAQPVIGRTGPGAPPPDPWCMSLQGSSDRTNTGNIRRATELDSPPSPGYFFTRGAALFGRHLPHYSTAAQRSIAIIAGSTIGTVKEPHEKIYMLCPISIGTGALFLGYGIGGRLQKEQNIDNILDVLEHRQQGTDQQSNTGDFIPATEGKAEIEGTR